MHVGLHHFRKKYRVPVPKLKRFEKLINVSVYSMGLMVIISNIPQLLTIWIDRKTEGVSVLTWIGFSLGSLFWLGYGILHRERPIIVTNAAALVVHALIVTGLLMNR